MPNAPAEPVRPAWYDAHLDLAMMAVLGRDMHAQPRDAGGPDLPASVTLPSLRDGRVTHALATIFTECNGTDARIGYPEGNAGAAHTVGLAQLDVYQQWEARADISIKKPGTPLTPTPAPTANATSGAGAKPPASLRVGILMEGADPIRTPDELEWWANRGVLVVALAWWTPSRYSGGNGTLPTDPRTGLSDLGRELVREIDRLDLVHDVSHLSDAAFNQLMATARGRVIASHSNCRAILGDPANQRHLSDPQIKAIAARAGVIGLNLYTRFLSAARHAPESGRATIDETLAHIEHICSLVGHKRAVGLGTDADGGFSAARLPEGIDVPADYIKLCEGLRNRGWNDSDIGGFVSGNFARVVPLD